jgi:hypothetical protein
VHVHAPGVGVMSSQRSMGASVRKASLVWFGKSLSTTSMDCVHCQDKRYGGTVHDSAHDDADFAHSSFHVMTMSLNVNHGRQRQRHGTVEHVKPKRNLGGVGNASLPIPRASERRPSHLE